MCWDSETTVYYRPRAWENYSPPVLEPKGSIKIAIEENEAAEQASPSDSAHENSMEAVLQEADYNSDSTEEAPDELDVSPAPPAEPAILQATTCKRCKFVNHDGCTHCYMCRKELLNSTIGVVAVTLATNAIVSDYVASLGLEWVPVY